MSHAAIRVRIQIRNFKRYENYFKLEGCKVQIRLYDNHGFMLFGPSKLEHMRLRSPIKDWAKVIARFRNMFFKFDPFLSRIQFSMNLPTKSNPSSPDTFINWAPFLKWIQSPSISKLIVHSLKTTKGFWTSWWHRTTTIGITVRPQGLN